ncbi:alpha-L-fucosidase [Polaribacter batillariae]|uniref:alpha-L-fucosidase n=1 Tax=Polaribacter batillariae TaxID=2808900 RepID=A0ABX7SYV8_9FLAO|nr:alpha-L-fucosidase [Polaribacter batillariae]QTD38460.1 alpha-L-fucosidase [Polaribacter batillariae]
MKYIFRLAKVIFLATFFLIIGCNKTEKNTPYFLKDYQETFENNPREAALQWFDDARLGMFIHWGVWGPKHAEWAMYNETIPLSDYKKLAKNFKANNFDAEAIVNLAKSSGMNYITFVAKHHDGFSLWDSDYSDWDSMDYPAKRDFLKELSEACRKNNMPLFIYYSIGIDWTHPFFIPREKYVYARPNYKETPDYFLYKSPEDFEKYREFCKNQLKELSTKYGDVAGFWFDTLGGVLANDELFNMQEFYDVIHQYQPHALIHFKTGATGTEDVLVGERELKSISIHYQGDDPEKIKIRQLADKVWNNNKFKKAEIAVTSQGSWAWTPTNKCRASNELYAMLAHASNNNANLLLNVGLKPDGSIPKDVEKEFRLLGKRIQKEGYPILNKKGWKALRGEDVSVDSTEVHKTAR